MTFLGPLDRFDGMIPKRPRRRAITERQRRRVERHARAALALVAPDVPLRVLWHHDDVDEFAETVVFDAHAGAWIAISERAWLTQTPLEREDTIRHEIAHVIAWRRYGVKIRPHGREWLAARRDLDEALDASDEV